MGAKGYGMAVAVERVSDGYFEGFVRFFCMVTLCEKDKGIKCPVCPIGGHVVFVFRFNASADKEY